MPADWKGFIDSFSAYLTSKVEKTPQKNADKLIELYLDALSNRARPLPGTALFNKKPEVITGFVNQLGAFLVWLLPKKLAESIAASLYGL